MKGDDVSSRRDGITVKLKIEAFERLHDRTAQKMKLPFARFISLKSYGHEDKPETCFFNRHLLVVSVLKVFAGDCMNEHSEYYTVSLTFIFLTV